MKKENIAAAGVAAGAVAVVTMVVYAILGCFPFGSESVALTDVNQQVIPLLGVFKDIVAGKESIFYSFTYGGGMNMYGVFFFFLSSPFSLIALFCSKANLPLAINIILACKLVSAGAAGGYAVKKLVPRIPWQLAAVLGTAYGLCGYGLQYYQNILWLDIQILFPLLLVSLILLLQKGKCLPYLILLTAAAVICYYLSYMLALFLVLFAAGFCFIKKEGGAAAKMLGCSVCALLLSAVCWLPAVWQSVTSGRSSSILDKLSTTSLFGALETKLPIFLSTGLVLALLFLIRAKLEKMTYLYLGLLVATVLPVVFEPICKMWEWGDYQCFPVRYGFLPLFLILLLAGYSFLRDEDEPQKSNLLTNTAAVVYTVAVIAGIVWYVITFRDEMDAYPETLWGDETSLKRLVGLFCICGVGYAVILLLYRLRRVALPVAAACLLVLTSVEGGANLTVYTQQGANKTDLEKYQAVTAVADQLTDDEFVRVGVSSKQFPSNWIGGAGLASLGHYTSFTPMDNISLFRTLGYSSNWMELSPSGGTLFTDALLCRGYNITSNNGEYSLTEAGETFSFATLIDSGVYAHLPSQRIPAQETLFEAMFPDAGTLFTTYRPTGRLGCTYSDENGEYVIKKTGGTAALYYSVTIEEPQTLYFDCYSGVNTKVSDSIYGSVSVTVNGTKVSSSYPTANENGLLCLGYFESGTVTVLLSIEDSIDAVSFGVYGLSESVLNAAFDSVTETDLQPSKNKITGTVTTDEAAAVLCSVPYSESFTAYGNGKKLECRDVGGFLAIEVPAGETEITVKYTPSGFVLGVILSLVGVAMLVLGIVFRKKLAEVAESCNTAARWFWWICGAVVLIGIYIVPILWSLM